MDTTQTHSRTDVLQQKTSHQRHRKWYGSTYANLLLKWDYHYRDRIDKILLATNDISLPNTFAPFEQYFTGFEFEYYSFDNSPEPNLHGCWDLEGNTVRVFFAKADPPKRQRFTIAHELMHVYQHFDPEFLQDIEAIPFVPLVRDKLLDRLADKAAAYYLVPAPILKAHMKKDADLRHLSNLFGVSTPVLEICRKDYRIHQPFVHRPPW